MMKFIIIVAIAVGGYFLFQKIQADKVNQQNVNVESSTAAGKITNRIINEDIDAEFKRRTAQ